jgi:polyisoprenoid-binding protein YceI
MSVAENTGTHKLLNGAWQVDPVHTVVEFRVRHLMIATVKGRFRDFDGAIVPDDVPSVAGTIRVGSLETLDARRDEHLRSPEFFDVERYPEITFESKEIRLNGDDRAFLVPGELTIKGVTRPMALDGEFRGSVVQPDGAERVAFALRGELERTDFGLVWNQTLETGGMFVGNTVELALDVSAVRVA